MAKKRASTPSPDEPSQNASIRQSASKIWLAGLGAFSKAQLGSSKVFETLVHEGDALSQHARKLAGERVSLVTDKVSKVGTEISKQANGTWDKLEHVFEERVARALERLGVPTREQFDALSRRLDELGKASARKPSKTARPAAKSQKSAGTLAAKQRAPAAKRPATKKTLVRRAKSS